MECVPLRKVALVLPLFLSSIEQQVLDSNQKYPTKIMDWTHIDSVSVSAQGTISPISQQSPQGCLWTHVHMGCFAVGRNSWEHWPSGCVENSTRWKYLYIGHSLPFLLHKALPQWPATSLSTQSLAWIPKLKQDLTSAMGIMHRARDINCRSITLMIARTVKSRKLVCLLVGWLLNIPVTY